MDKRRGIPSYDLAAGQGHFLSTLRNGPGHCPADMLTGPDERVLMGLKAHANAVSHARLNALEETYLRTCKRLDRLHGEGHFNSLCREFIGRTDVIKRPLAQIGFGFDKYLQEQGCDPATVDLAAIEMNWLGSYHAADCEAVTLEHISALDEADLMDLPILLHPAVRVRETDGPLAAELEELHDFNNTAAVATTRPEHIVMFVAWTDDALALFRLAQNERRMCNLLDSARELMGEDKIQRLVLALIRAGIFRSPVM